MLKMLCSGMVFSYPTIIPGLRSPFDPVNGLFYFGRMLDKIRLQAAGKLPEGWQAARGTTMRRQRIRADAHQMLAHGRVHRA